MFGKLRELIRSVRQCKTAAEERKVIAKESAILRDIFKKQDTTYQHRNVAKLMYIHMMGYPTHFGQMECLKLIAAPSFAEKRIGYLGLMVLLDERQEVLMLVTNSLKNDLNSANENIVGLALVAMGNICSIEMARDLSPDVENLLRNGSSNIKRKAALCAVRILHKLPDLIESYADISIQLLSDRQHGVLLTGITLISEICALDVSQLEPYRHHVPQLCRILRNLLVSGFSPEYDSGGINDPFLQVKILRLLRILGEGNSEASDQMSDILAQVATNTESARTTGNSILYECVLTIMNVESIGGLRVLGINILGRFLSNKDNNIRYVALNTLSKVVSIDAQAVQRHRETIVECVKDADISIRKIALELVYSLVNEGNIKNLTRELLEYLIISDIEFKPDLTSKICSLIQKFAPDKKWHIDSMIKVLIQAGKYVKDEVCRSFIVLITNAADYQPYVVRALYTALGENVQYGHISLISISCWCLGEYGECLMLRQDLKEDEVPLEVEEKDVVDLLETVLKRLSYLVVLKEYALTALMKLAPKMKTETQRIRSILIRYQSDVVLEVQQRSCEYVKILQYEQLYPNLLERMPALDEKQYAENVGMDGNIQIHAENGNGTQNGVSQTRAPIQDLLGLDDIITVTPIVTSEKDLLGDLISTEITTVNTLPPTPSAAASASNAPADLLDILSGGSAVVESPAFPEVTAYENHGILIKFSFSKNHLDQKITDIMATYCNTTSASIEDFAVQVAVPKTVLLKLSPASSNLLTPSSPITQKIEVNNTLQGEKPLAMRLKISGKVGEHLVTDMAEVRNFPTGL